ncbi:MAG: cytochrome b/b6 domain-containing protein [Nitrospiraceae bacterium]
MKTTLEHDAEAIVSLDRIEPTECAAQADPVQATPQTRPDRRIYRHTAPVRLSHWVNAVCLFVLIGSGLQIFNAHPALYWGDRSDRDQPLLAMRAVRSDSGEPHGITAVLGHDFDTTGLLGYSGGRARGFPAWATIPGPQWLAMGRQWHLFFAWLFVVNGLIFWAYGWLSRHFTHEVIPKGRDLRTIGGAIRDHVRLKHPTGDDVKHYNVLQKLAYAAVILGLGPLIVLTGLTMSPTIDAAAPWLLDLFGGRQSARTIHFLACFAFVGFIVIHVSQVILTGFVNHLRSMITGWYRLPVEESIHEL